jgi:Nif-specific regulatory protein
MNKKDKDKELVGLREKLEQKDSEIQAIIDACRKITSSLNVEEVLRFIQESARKLMDAESSSVILLDSGGENLHIASSTGSKEKQVKGLRFPADKGIAGWVISKGQPLIVNNVNGDPRFYPEIDQISGYRTDSICASPMTFRGKIMGVIEVLNHPSPEGFSREKLELFSTFADLAAIALKNAISFDNLTTSYRLLHEQMRIEGIYQSENRKMQKVYEMCHQVAPLESTVLLQGESGTGKELLADLIHRMSNRKDKPLVKVNVPALPENLVESELFGHEKGAFTGAVSRKTGKFEQADRGTIFLDEIGELRPDTQVKLLRFLQEHTFERIGSTEIIKVDVRIIAATNRKLEQAVASGDFRTDLFYRLNVVPVQVPPLRERKEDIPLLIDFFIRKFNSELARKVEGISTEALSLLISHPWPGNIRELENIIERIMVMRQSGVILPQDIPSEIVQSDTSSGFSASRPADSQPSGMWDLEKDLIEKTLQANSFNQSETARKLGITLNQLRYRIKKFKIDINK